MKRIQNLLVAVLVFTADSAMTQGDEADITSQVLKTDSKQTILVQEVLIRAPIEDVWNAYTTSEGWMAWAAPQAKVDLRVGGTIQTQYSDDARVGDPGTNTLHIVNYVPERILTLRAELQDRWPSVMKQDAGHLMNVIVFTDQGASLTSVESFGVGYRSLPEYDELMKFFIPANEGLLMKLKLHLEE